MGITVAVTRVAANTSTGNQAITTTDLGGLTPKAYMLIATRCITDGTAATGVGMYIGMSDGTHHVNQAYEEEEAQASSDSQHTADATSPPVFIIYDGTADSVIDGSATHVSLDTNGCTINWSDAPSAGWLITAVFFAGSDLSASVFVPISLGNTTDNAVDITTISFEADDVITMRGGSGTPGWWNMGFIHNDRAGGVTQRTYIMQTRTGRPTMEMHAQMRNDACLCSMLATGSVNMKCVASAFDGSGFTATTAVAAGESKTIAGLALRYGSSPVVSSKVYTFSTPTGTGDNTDAGPGFTPQAIFYLPNFTQAANTAYTDANAGTSGIIVIDGDEAYCNAISSEDGAADSNTQSLSDDQAVNLPTHAGAAGQAATFVSFGATGVTLNWSDIEAAAKLWPALAIGGAAGYTPINVTDAGDAWVSADAISGQNNYRAGLSEDLSV